MLSDYHATLKNAETGQYLDLCQGCLPDYVEEVGIVIKDNPTLLYQSNTYEDNLDNLGIDGLEGLDKY
jgi:hypothetical protein